MSLHAAAALQAAALEAVACCTKSWLVLQRGKRHWVSSGLAQPRILQAVHKINDGYEGKHRYSKRLKSM
jgi:hypothetical protein